MTDAGGQEDALAANRVGRLSPQQLRRLEAQLSRGSASVTARVFGALGGMDKALRMDAREGRVESIEGAITKKNGDRLDVWAPERCR